MDDLKKRLDDALERKDKAEKNIERVQGRLDSARRTVEGVEAECREKKVDPDKLDDTITMLEGKLASAVDDLEGRIRQTESQIAPFLGGENA